MGLLGGPGPGNTGQADHEEDSLDLAEAGEAGPSYPGAGDSLGAGQMEAGQVAEDSWGEDDQSLRGAGDLRSQPPGHHRGHTPPGRGHQREEDGPDTPDLDCTPRHPLEAVVAAWLDSAPWLGCTPGLLPHPH